MLCEKIRLRLHINLVIGHYSLYNIVTLLFLFLSTYGLQRLDG